jgi:hypothetical protein
MSVRGLAVMALVLLAMCVAAALRLLDPFGWWRSPPPPEWTVFVNPTLSVTRGQRLVLRPMLEGERMLRYTFLTEKAEPMTDDPMLPVPYRGAGVEELNGDLWEFRSPEPLALCQMGALTPQEWLEEIGPVEQRGGQGGPRTLLRAVYGHRNGSAVLYYFDPERTVPVVGWVRRELIPQDGSIPEVLFASDGGIVKVPPPPDVPKPPK